MANTLLDAVNAGLSQADGTSTTATQDTTTDEATDNATDVGTDVSTDDADANNGHDAASDATGDGAPGDGSATEEDADADGDVEDQGDDPDADQEATAAEGDRPSAVDDKNKAGAKQKDPINDPIPPELKKETRERIQTLANTVKSVTGERDKIASERDELMAIITESTASPQQYGEALDFIRMVNSGDPAQLEQALGLMQNTMSAIAKALGKPVPGVDLLAEHQDLRDAVADGAISQQHAEELAAARSHTQLRTQHANNQRQERQQTEATQQAVTAGRQALNELEARYRKTDPQYEAKKAILLEAMRPAIAAAHPSRWAQIWETAYNGLKLPAAPKAPAKTGQPMRAKTPSGGAQKAPGSLLEAINMSLEQ